VGVRLSEFARGVTAETAFAVLARARDLKARGKDVVELEIGDSPFPTTAHARQAGIQAIEEGQTFYGPSQGLPEFRAVAAEFVRREFGIPAGPENIVVGPGAKIFETLFCEAFLDPGDGVLIFTPQFPTYVPNVQRRGARYRLVPLKEDRQFRPDPAAVARFLKEDPRPRAIFLNSPHNPTGGVALREDLEAIAELVRGTETVVFSDEPYCHMAWSAPHCSILSLDGMLDHAVAAFTFSKSYSMSGWRLGFAVMSTEYVETFTRLVNTSLSCVPPFIQRAGIAALLHDGDERDRNMAAFRRKVERLVKGLAEIPGVSVCMPGGTFYVFPNFMRVCNDLGITSHGLAMYLLEGASPEFGVACLGGECFGGAGAGYLRFSCAEPDERIDQAVAFIQEAIRRHDAVRSYLESHPEYRLTAPYPCC